MSDDTATERQVAQMHAIRVAGIADDTEFESEVRTLPRRTRVLAQRLRREAKAPD